AAGGGGSQSVPGTGGVGPRRERAPLRQSARPSHDQDLHGRRRPRGPARAYRHGPRFRALGSQEPERPRRRFRDLHVSDRGRIVHLPGSVHHHSLTPARPPPGRGARVARLTMRLEVDVVLRRGPIAESRHRVTVAVCGAGGSGTGPSAPGGADPAAAGGPADPVTTFRSAAKPFQLLPLVERGHAERWGWSDEQLAVMCASHTGSAYHAGLVRGVLERIGCTERDLVCGYHETQDPESREHLAAQ